ncbi:MAG: tetratricopeptide repeat protein [Gammaproteobacteria bacterium]
MDVYRTEEEQVEALKKWWDDNGKSIIFGIIVGLGAVFGWRSWQDHKIAQAEAASELYQTILTSLRAEKPADAEAPAMEIINNYSGTGYAVFARLTLAKLAVEDDNYEQAAEHLEQALQMNDTRALDLAIRLRLARVHLARQQYDDALALLQVRERREYASAFDELKGDILAQKGDRQAALEAYRQALTAAQSRSADTSVLEMKMNDMGAGSPG